VKNLRRWYPNKKYLYLKQNIANKSIQGIIHEFEKERVLEIITPLELVFLLLNTPLGVLFYRLTPFKA